MPVTNVPTPGSPIRSNWAQSVSNLANANEAAIPTKLGLAGGTMTGTLRVGGNPSNAGGSDSSIDGRFNSSVVAPAAANSASIVLTRAGSPTADAAASFIRFWRDANPTPASPVLVGSITVSAGGSGVVYNTSSDHRLKDDLGPILDALERVAALQPKRVRWKATGAETDGFLAHEVADVMPELVAGDYDAVLPDDEGGGIDPQQLDLLGMIPVLVAAVQQLAAQVAELEAR